MTEIEDLIKQAQEVKEKWRKPDLDEPRPKPVRSWREILEGRTAPRSWGD